MDMRFLAAVFLLLKPAIGYYQGHQNPNVDEVSLQLPEYRDAHQKSINVLTTNDGKPVDVSETATLNTDLLTNQYFFDGITSLVNENIPARIAAAKGPGAFGYFKVTNDITKYTKAKLFCQVGKSTPLVARFAVSTVGPTGSDTTTVAIRSFALKFYTEDGNLDLLSINVPVFLTRDPIDFSSFIHAFAFNPKNNIRDRTSTIDIVLNRPNSLHAVLWEISEYGLPKGYRHMNGFPVHTFRLYNNDGDVFYVRFKLITTLGYEGLTLEDAMELSGSDPDFFSRDLYDSIERQKFPSWRLEMDVLTKDIKQLDFDPFDVTRLWKNGTFCTVEIGRITLNKNVDNHFAQVEQAAFNPGHLVPGIATPLDKLYKGRIIAYREAQTHRLGINHNKIQVNCPLHLNNYNRNGVPPVLDNMKDAPNYTPNSFNGPKPTMDCGKPNNSISIFESNAIDLEPARNFYNNILVNEKQKQRLIDNFVQISLRVSEEIIQRVIASLNQIDKDLGCRYNRSISAALKAKTFPNVVEDLK